MSQHLKIVYRPLEDSNLPWIVEFYCDTTNEWVRKVWCCTEQVAKEYIAEQQGE